AHVVEIGTRRKAGASAMAVPLVKHQARGRHHVEHRRNDVAVEARRRHLAVFGKALLVLRPKTMHHEAIGAFPTLLVAGAAWSGVLVAAAPCSPLGARLAEGRGP